MDKNRDRLNAIQSSSEFLIKVTEEINKTPSPTFRDLKRLIKGIAKNRNEPIDHIIIEAYTNMLVNKITFEMDKGNL